MESNLVCMTQFHKMDKFYLFTMFYWIIVFEKAF